MNGGTRRQWRRIERALMGELPAAERRQLFVELRGDPALRGRWDAAISALRLLEGDRDVSEVELSLVEGWVLDDLPAEVVTAPKPWSRWSLALAFAVAALVLFVVMPRPSPAPEGRWDARGVSAPGRLTLQALCGPAQSDALAGGAEPRCAPDDVLGFAYFVRPDARGARLTLFGIDADGDPMYYAPTPADVEAIDVERGRWAAMDGGVNLEVNHATGPLRVFGLLAPRAASIVEIDGWVRDLRDLEAARPGDRAWPQRLGSPTLQGLCPTAGDCDAVELRLWIGARTP